MREIRLRKSSSQEVALPDSLSLIKHLSVSGQFTTRSNLHIGETETGIDIGESRVLSFETLSPRYLISQARL